MPSIVPSYLYTFFALMLVGTILIGTFNSFAASLRQIPEEKMLRNILEYVAAESLELINFVEASSEAFAEIVLKLPSSINHRQYWLRLGRDSAYTFIEAGFGAVPSEARFKAYLLANVSASGEIVGGYGKVLLTCRKTASGIHLILGYLEG